MIYPYQCECGKRCEVIKPVSVAARAEPCPVCRKAMCRIYTVPQVSVPDMQPHFNYGLGKEIHNKRDVKDAIQEMADGKTRGRTIWKRDLESNQVYTEQIDVPGREIVEVGNDKQVPKKPSKHTYELPRETLDRIYRPE